MRHLLIVFSFLLSFSTYGQETPVTTELEQKLAAATDPVEQAELCNTIARSYMNEDLDKSNAFATRGIGIAIEHGAQWQLSMLYATEGVVKFKMGEHRAAFAIMDSSLVLCREIGNVKGVGIATGNIGVFHYLNGDYDNALKYHYEGLGVYEQLNDTMGIANSLVNIMAIQEIRGDFSSAKATAYRAYELFNRMADAEGKALLAFNLATIYTKQNNLDSATIYVNEAIRLNEGMHNEEGIADGYRELAAIEIMHKNYEEARHHVEEAIRGYEEIGYVLKQVESIDYLINIAYDLGEYRQSITLSEDFLQKAKNIGARQFERDALLWLMKSHSALGEYERAYRYSEVYLPLRDSIMNETNVQQIEELKTKYETEQKEQENESLRQKGEIQSLEIYRKQYLIYALAGIIVLIVILAFVFIRQNRIISRQRNMELEQRLLRTQMNPHFIFNALIAIQSYVYKNDPKESGRFISSFAKLMRSILENSRKDYITLREEIEWLKNYLDLQKLRFENRFEYHIEVDESIETDFQKIPPMLTQPFIENALEHGFRNIDYPGELVIAFRGQENLVIEVKDNGVGYENAPKEESGGKTSLATSITRDRLQLLNSNRSRKIAFNIEKVEPSGTRVRFEIPE